jgi:hypothetical protein
MSSFFDDYESIPNPRLKEKRDSWIPEAIFNRVLVKLGLVRKGKKYITNMKVQKVMADAPQ